MAAWEALEAMAISGLPISTLLSRLPRYAIHKTRIPTRSTRGSYSELNRLVEHLRSIGEADNVTTTDGVRIDYSDGWVHARVSRTQNMIRIISEAETRERALQLSDVVMRIVQAES
jgi:phosphomannomutase